METISPIYSAYCCHHELCSPLCFSLSFNVRTTSNRNNHFSIEVYDILSGAIVDLIVRFGASSFIKKTFSVWQIYKHYFSTQIWHQDFSRAQASQEIMKRVCVVQTSYRIRITFLISCNNEKKKKAEVVLSKKCFIRYQKAVVFVLISERNLA